MELDEKKIIPDPSLSLEEFPIAPWNSSEYRWMYQEAKRERSLPRDLPISKMTEQQKKSYGMGMVIMQGFVVFLKSFKINDTKFRFEFSWHDIAATINAWTVKEKGFAKNREISKSMESTSVSFVRWM